MKPLSLVHVTNPRVATLDASRHRSFPNATVFPKLHMLEDHIVTFIQLWRVGLGMLGEQGAESIHTRFNQLEWTYASMRNGVERLKSMVAEHFRQVCPDNIVKQPPQKKMKRNEEEK